jgi:hypothetical protein
LNSSSERRPRGKHIIHHSHYSRQSANYAKSTFQRFPAGCARFAYLRYRSHIPNPDFFQQGLFPSLGEAASHPSRLIVATFAQTDFTERHGQEGVHFAQGWTFLSQQVPPSLTHRIERQRVAAVLGSLH